jgi:orotidine-5'-phosphate decarboxylase
VHWGDSVKTRIESFGNLVLGIDPSPEHAPLGMLAQSDRFLERYTESLLDAAGADKVAFVKFQSAYFEAWGSEGLASLSRCISMARERQFSIILDAKRGDIGSTAEAYARAYLEPGQSDLEVDCLTVNPFLGPDTLEPFVDRARHFGKGLFILVKTSNPGSGWLQDQQIENISVSERIADAVARWADQAVGSSGVSAVGAVVGATYPNQGKALRTLMPRSTFLAPGLGAQGGDPVAMSALGTDTGPVLVSVSRGAAAVEDRMVSNEEYVLLVRSRIDRFRAMLKLTECPDA